MAIRKDLSRDPLSELKSAAYSGAATEITVASMTAVLPKQVKLAENQIDGAIAIFKKAIAGISEIEKLIPNNSPVGKSLASQLGIELGEVAGDAASLMIKGI